jgi:hypothetical protein
MHEPRWFRTAILFALLTAALVFAVGLFAHLRAQIPTLPDKPYVIEYYYKTKWGHADEFLTLFKKNHYPVLLKEKELGRIVRVFMTAPVYHTTEDGRWDYRVTIVFKNAAIANDGYDSAPIIKQLFPDQDTYKREEQRRFEILEAHWDLPVKDVELETK